MTFSNVRVGTKNIDVTQNLCRKVSKGFFTKRQIFAKFYGVTQCVKFYFLPMNIDFRLE